MEVPHTDLTEVTGMVFVEVDSEKMETWINFIWMTEWNISLIFMQSEVAELIHVKISLKFFHQIASLWS